MAVACNNEQHSTTSAVDTAALKPTEAESPVEVLTHKRAHLPHPAASTLLSRRMETRQHRCPWGNLL